MDGLWDTFPTQLEKNKPITRGNSLANITSFLRIWSNLSSFPWTDWQYHASIHLPKMQFDGRDPTLPHSWKKISNLSTGRGPICFRSCDLVEGTLDISVNREPLPVTLLLPREKKNVKLKKLHNFYPGKKILNVSSCSWIKFIRERKPW